MKKIKKAQSGTVSKFFEGQVENVDTVSMQDYINAKNAYLKGKKLEGNKVFDNWDKYNYVRQYFEQNPKAKEATVGSTYDKFGNIWDDQILEGYGDIKVNKSNKSLGLSPTGNVAKYINNKPLVEPQFKKGGVIEDNMGQWKYPGKVTKINSNNITMKGVKEPLIGISDSGDIQYMEPEKNYRFKGKSVTEYPLDKLQEGGILENLGTGLLNNANNIVGGIGFLKQQKQQRQALKQGVALSNLTKQVSELDPELIKRKYVRPEDSIIDPNNLNPSYGTGSNFLAKNGKTVKKADWGETLGNLSEKNIDNVLGSYIGGGTGQVSGESMLGKGIGGTLGNIILPGIGGKIGGALGGFVGGIFGAEGQRKDQSRKNLINNNLVTAAFNQGNRNSPFMKNGGTTELNGELQTLWGGDVEPISENPYLPDTGKTVMFKGNSHDTVEKGKSGIGVKFGNSMIEVEGGEPAVKTKNNDLTVFGNMKIPSYGVSELQDKNAKGKKFKTYVADLSKKEDKQNKIIDDFTNKLDTEPVITPFDKLSFNSSKSMIKGADMNLKEIAAKKQIASSIQDAILQTAEENNLDSDALAKGKIKKAKNEGKAQSGKTVYIGADKITKEQADKDGWVKFNSDDNLYHKENSYKDPFLKIAPKTDNLANEQDYWDNTLIPLLQKGHSPNQLVEKGWMHSSNLDKANQYFTPSKINRQMAYVDNTLSPEIKLKPGNPNFSYKPNYMPGKKPESPDKKEGGGTNWMDLFNSALPYFRPSNQQPLDPNQLAGEMYALSNNQLEPVQAQKYSPLLEQATDISLQDQLNANQADFNAIQRLSANNPAALAQLAAQKYQANSNVLGEQFRINQNQKLSTYNKNREILNDATLKNLAILDQQYTRQSQAKSNTKAVAQQALNSIADKIAKNKLENRTLGIYENLYNYRYLPNGQAVNLNPLAKWNMNGDNLPTLDENGDVTVEQTVETDGKKIPTKYKTKTRTKSSNGSVVKAIKGY